MWLCSTTGIWIFWIPSYGQAKFFTEFLICDWAEHEISILQCVSHSCCLSFDQWPHIGKFVLHQIAQLPFFRQVLCACGVSWQIKGEINANVEVQQSQCTGATLFYLFNGLNCKQHILPPRSYAIANVKFTKLQFGIRTDLWLSSEQVPCGMEQSDILILWGSIWRSNKLLFWGPSSSKTCVLCCAKAGENTTCTTNILFSAFFQTYPVVKVQ